MTDENVQVMSEVSVIESKLLHWILIKRLPIWLQNNTSVTKYHLATDYQLLNWVLIIDYQFYYQLLIIDSVTNLITKNISVTEYQFGYWIHIYQNTANGNMLLPNMCQKQNTHKNGHICHIVQILDVCTSGMFVHICSTNELTIVNHVNRSTVNRCSVIYLIWTNMIMTASLLFMLSYVQSLHVQIYIFVHMLYNALCICAQLMAMAYKIYAQCLLTYYYYGCASVCIYNDYYMLHPPSYSRRYYQYHWVSSISCPTFGSMTSVYGCHLYHFLFCWVYNWQ